MTDVSSALLAVRDLNIAVVGRTLVAGLQLTVETGETLVILGRNGSGKTTLLHTLANLRAPAAGQVELCGRPYDDYEPRAAAHLRGLLTQSQNDSFPSSVLETALIGRHPHLGRWAWEGAADERIALTALAAVGLAGLEQRQVSSLSGGERQRLAIATLLTQQPRLYLLDEPLAHLDLGHQIAILELVQRYASENRAGFILALHDVNLALRYCRRALLLFGDGRWIAGPSKEVLTSENLSALYGHPLQVVGTGASSYFIAA
ncbi:MAG: ABC transporter ATP-binding protein [Betaproteobacteria bacterium]|nr:ABC transporter ATP-binding protein [Betaproteobacteria bacterium]